MIYKRLFLTFIVSCLFLAGCGNKGKINNALNGTWYGYSYTDDENNTTKDNYGSLTIEDGKISVDYNDIPNVEADIKSVGLDKDLEKEFDEEYILYVDGGEQVGYLYYNSDEDLLVMSFDDYNKSRISYTRYEQRREELIKPLERDNPDFRNTCWGDDIETVKQYESSKLVDSDDDSLTYETTVNGYNVYLLYFFDDNKLFRTGYVLEDNYSAGQYISIMESFRDDIEEKYGLPLEDSGMIKFEKDSLIEMAGEARALELGYIGYAYEWNTDSTKILLGCTSSNYEVQFTLGYQDMNYHETSNDL